jgi:hypothetical protein
VISFKVGSYVHEVYSTFKTLTSRLNYKLQTSCFAFSDLIGTSNLTLCLSNIAKQQRNLKSTIFWVVTLCTWVLLATCLLLVSCFAYSSILKMEATCSSEMLVNFFQAIRHYNPDHILHSHHCENLRSKIVKSHLQSKYLGGKNWVVSTMH